MGTCVEACELSAEESTRSLNPCHSRTILLTGSVRTRILPEDGGVLKETDPLEVPLLGPSVLGGRDPRAPDDDFEPAADLSADSMLQELRARQPRGPGGPNDFFWSSLAPMSLLASLATATLVFVLAAWFMEAELGLLLRVGGLVFAAGVALLLPLQYYVVRSRLEAPLERLEHELLGHLPWRAEGDVLLASLRRSVSRVRLAAMEARSELEHVQDQAGELRARLEEQQAADRFVNRVADVLRQAEPLGQFAGQTAKLFLELWPADHVLLLVRGDSESELEIFSHETPEGPVPQTPASEGAPRYRRSSLPAPVKEALRRGFFEETGLPFSRDPSFPEARSFVAVALEHRGRPAGVLLGVSAVLQPPSAEGLRRARPLLSIGFSRSMYLREMEEAAIRDALTGVYTQDHFLSMLRHEVARSNRYSRPASCALVDIDGLRRVNDLYGARFGDQVIAEVAQLVKAAIRSSDILARVSGGELVLLLPETNADSARVVAERVRAKVEEHPFIIQPNQLERLTVSIGIGIHPPHGVTAFSLMDAARSALRRAKLEGRNRVSLADGQPVA